VHTQAYQFVAEHAPPGARRVLDIGGRNINGSPRALFPGAEVYRVLDIAPGAGVDIVADAAVWTPDGSYDVVVICEVFEHTAVWPAIAATAYAACAPGGLLITTMAGPGRASHSAVDGGPVLYDGEHYANVPATELHRVLTEVGWRDIVVDSQPNPADTRSVATK
jgi:hypothetical protein